MIQETITNDSRTSLRRLIVSYTQSLARKGQVSFLVETFSEYLGVVTIQVNGKFGTISKNIIVSYNQLTAEWEIYNEKFKFRVMTLSDLTGVVKTLINKLNNLIGKI